MPLEPSPNDVSTPEPEEDRGSALGSAVKALGVGAMRGIVTPAIELNRQMTGQTAEDPAGLFAKASRGLTTALEGTITPSRLSDRDAKFLPGPGEQSVFKHPWSTLMMKGADIAPTLAGLALTKGAGAQAALGAAQGVGGYMSETAGTLEKASDEQLAQQYPEFAKNIDWGLPSGEARKLLAAELNNPVSMGASALGGAAQTAGVGGIFRGGTGALRGAAIHGGGAAAGMGAGGGVSDFATQYAEIQTGKRQQFDMGEIAHAMAEDAAMGLFVGGVGGGIHGAIETATRPRIPKPGEVKVGEGNTPTSAEGEALAPLPPEQARATPTPGAEPPAAEPPGAGGPAGETRGLDQQIADARARREAAVVPPPVETPVPPPVPPQGAPPAAGVPAEARPPTEVAAGAPPGLGPSPTAIPPEAGGRAPLADAIHAAAPVNTKYGMIEARVKQAMGDAAPAYKELQPVLRDMVNRGELKYDPKRGYRSLRQPAGIEPVAAPAPAPVVERPVAVAPEIAPAVEAARPEADAAEPARPPASEPVVEVSQPARAATEPVTEPVTEPAQVIPPVERKGPSPQALTPEETAAKAARTAAIKENLQRKGPFPQEPAAPVVPAEVRPPRVFAKPVAPEVAAERAKAAAHAEGAPAREANAERMRNKRQKEHADNDAKAEKIVKDQWVDDEGQSVHPANDHQVGLALTGDIKAIAGVVARAHRVELAAEDAGVSTKDSRTAAEAKSRQTFRIDDPEAKNLTPWTNFVRQSAEFRKFGEHVLAGKVTPDKIRVLVNRVDEYAASERAMRDGKFEEANRDQRMRNIKGKEVSEAREAVDEEGEPIRRIEPKFSRGNTGVDQNGVEGIHAPEGVHSSDVHPDLVAPKPFWDALNKSTATPVRQLMNSHLRRMARSTDPVGQRLYGVLKRLVNLAGDTKVVIMSDEDFAHMHPGAAGAWLQSTDEGFARGNNGTIVMSQRGATVHTVMHETTHAVVSRELMNNPQLRADVQRILDEVKAKWQGDPKAHGLTDVHEFLSEAMSNADFQTELQGITLSKPVGTRWGQVKDAWSAFVARTAEALGFRSRGEKNALEAAMLAFDEAAMHNDATRFQAAMDLPAAAPESTQPRYSMASEAQDRAGAYFQEHRGGLSEWKQRVQRSFNKVTMLTQLGHISDGLFSRGKDPTNQPQRKLVESMLRAGSHAEQIRAKDDPLILRLSDAARRYEGSGLWSRFENHLQNETSANVYGDKSIAEQKHLGKNAAASLPAKAAHERIAADYHDIFHDAKGKPIQELIDLRNDVYSFFKDRQSSMALAGINNILRALDPTGRGSEALAQRIHDGKTTADDREVLGTDAAMTALNNMKAYKATEGPYVPQMRRGDYISNALHVIPTIKSGLGKELRRMDESGQETPTGKVFEFKSEQDANAFLKNLDGLAATAERVHVDPDTGLNYYEEKNAAGNTVRKRLTAAETNTEERIRVHVENQYTKFHERLRHAKQDAARLRADPNFTDVRQPDERRFNAADVGHNFMPTQITNMATALQKRASFQALDGSAQREMLRHLHEMGIASMASTRAQSHRLPRRNVQGANPDLPTNTAHYSSSTAGYLGRLKYQPETDRYLKQMQDYTNEAAKSYDKSVNPTEDTQITRRTMLKEFEERVYATRDPEPSTLTRRIGNRLLQMSQMDKLISPAFHVINSAQVGMLTAPVLMARHGFKALGAITQAYKDLGAGGALLSGLKDTARAFRSNEPMTDYTKSYIDRLTRPGEKDVLAHLRDRSLLSPDAGMEVGKVVQHDANIAGRTLDRVDLMARQIGTAIESINRTVTGLAAYRLEMEKNGGNHELAKSYAYDTVHDTQGDYSSINAAPIFKSTLGRMAFQFKKFPQLMYYLLAKQVGAIAHGTSEERAQAIKTFAGLMVTHSMVAGVLGGIPGSEVVDAAMMAARMVGLTDAKYGDLERSFRAGTASIVGKPMGEIISRGWPRWLGADVATRVGWNSLVLSGQEPKSMKTDDLYAFFAKTFAGAPVGYVMDAIQGMQAAARGDFVEASRLMVPIKTYADSVQAYQMATVGKKSASGRPLMDPIPYDQMIVRMIGFNPGQVAEQNEQTFGTRDQIKERTDQRSKFTNDWIAAQPADRVAIQKDILAWNKTQPPDAQIKLGDLYKAMYSRQKQDASGSYKKGIQYNKRTRDLEGANSFYNTP